MMERSYRKKYLVIFFLESPHFFEDTFTFDNLSKIENFTVQTVADGQTDTTNTQLKKEVSYCDLAISDVKKEIVKDGVKYT